MIVQRYPAGRDDVAGGEVEHGGCSSPPHVLVGLGECVVGVGEGVGVWVVGVGDGVGLLLDENPVVIEKVGDGEWVGGTYVVDGTEECVGAGCFPFGKTSWCVANFNAGLPARYRSMNRCQVCPGRSAPYSGAPAELKIGLL
jgi:hypothetical protein